MDPQNLLTALDVRVTHHHLAVKPAGTHQGGVQDVGAVGSGNHDDALVGAKAVHLHQQLVQGLLTLVVSAAQASASLAAHGVDLVDEDNAGVVLLGLVVVLLGLVEQIPHTGGAHAHEHLHKVGAGDGEEGHPGLAGHSPGQQCFTSAGRAHQQHALGNAGAQGVVLVGVFKELHNLPELLLFLVGAGHVREGGLALLVAHLLDFGLAKVHLLVAAHAGAQAPHHDDPEDNQPREQNQRRQQADKPACLHRADDVLLHAGVGVFLVVLADGIPHIHVEQVHAGQHVAHRLAVL